MNIKQIFCEHCYRPVEINIPIHWPNSEPIKWGQIFICKKCNKILKFVNTRRIKII